MDKREYENIYKNEESHFYYVSLHKLVLSIISKYANDKNLNILDAGCGTGRLASLMESYGTVQAIDFSDEAIAFAKKRNVTVKKASVTQLPFPDNTFDVVTSIDVIYHKAVDDDVKALQEMYRVLKHGGVLIIRVQANPWLKLAHDRHVHGARRYTRNILRQKLEHAGFTIEKLSYIHMALLPPAIFAHFLQKVFSSKDQESSVQKVNPLLNSVGNILLQGEIPLLKHINIPFGLGVIAVAQKN